MKNLILTVGLLLQLVSLNSYGKALYMTVRRDFSSKEAAAIELNYMQTEPIYLRILSAKDQKAFIAGQIDLRRAWREPKSQFNPAYFLFGGQNKAQVDTDWIRYGVDFATRKSLSTNAGGAYLEGDKALFSKGQKKLITTPDGFNLVKELVVVPEVEDKHRAFDVPGFTDDWEYRGSLKTKIVSLPVLPVGFYVVQTIQGSLEGQVVVVINDFAAQLQVSNSNLIYRVANRSGAAVSGVQIETRNLSGQWIGKGQTDSHGELELKDVKDNDLVSVVTGPQGTAMIDSEYYSTIATFPDLYLYSDRPMYKSADTVHFRGILRQLNAGLSGTQTEPKQVAIGLEGLDGTRLGNEINVKVSEFGTFQGVLKTPEGKEGLVRVVARLGKAEHSGEIRVKEYVKPLFFININSSQENLKAGDTLKASLLAERYAGGAPTVSRARAQIYRVRMAAPQWVEDSGGGESGSSVTYGFDSSDKGASSLLPILVTEVENIEFDSAGKAQLQVAIPTEVKGSANYDYQYLLKVTVVDADDNVVVSSKKFFDLAADVVAQARFNKLVISKPAEAQLIVRSLSASGKTIAGTKGEVVFSIIGSDGKIKDIGHSDIQTDKAGKAIVSLPDSLVSLVGELTAVVKLYDSAKRSSTTESSLIVAGSKQGAPILDLREPRIVANKFEVTPSEKATLFLMLPKGWGPNGKDQGDLYITLAGDKIHSHRVVKVEGNSAWIEEAILPQYGTGLYISLSYPQAGDGWVERRSSFRIIDSGRKLKVTVKADAEMTVPGGPQGLLLTVKDSAGQPVRAELSVSVVDKAVLDLQPEIRPQLLDFFYPVTKLNLMSFVSSQFQGYGYGEEIAGLFQSNFSLAAAKAESKTMDQADTAYWNGQVLTNEKGEAKVAFTLPGNQTIWKVTSIAVDNSGRFGEGSGEFKAQAPVSVLLGYPSFIRKGDKARVKMNITSVHATESLPINYKLSAEGNNGLQLDHKVELQQTLKPNGQAREMVTLSAAATTKESTPLGLVGDLTFGKNRLKYRDTLKVESNEIVAPEYLFPDKNKFRLQLAANESAQSATVHVTSGLAGVLAPVMEWMIRYPYGCVEQTLNTTVPNLVLANWLEGAQKKGLVLSEKEKSLLAQAQGFGEMGISRLKSFQQKDGGFKWFVGDTGPADANMTLLVMTSLATATSGKLSLYDFKVSYRFLKKQNYGVTTPQGVFLTYIESMLNAKNVIYLSKDQIMPNLRVQVPYVLSQGSLMEKALLLNAIGTFRDYDVKSDLKAKLVQSVLQDMQKISGGTGFQNSKWSPTQSGWTAYPGHWISTLASVSAALKKTDAPAYEKVQTAVKWQIVNQFNGGHFGSTFDNAMVFLSSTYMLDDELTTLRNQNASINVGVKLNGKALSATEARRVQTLGGMTIDVPVADVNKGKSSEIEVTLPATMLARVIVQKRQPLASVAAQARGWKVERNYYLLDTKGGRSLIDPAKTHLKVGDLVYGEVKFTKLKEDNIIRSRYYVLTDGVPAGLTPIQEDKEYRASPFSLALGGSYRVREVGNERIRWYYDFSRGWMDRAEVTGTVFRVNYAGSFETGITRLDDFYDETQSSFSPSVRLDIDSVDGK